MENIEYINDCLRRYPEDIYKASMRTEELREAWQLTEARKDYETAKAFLTAKASGLTVGEADKTATASVYETAGAVIMAESSYRRAMADQLRLENEFVGVRKQASLLELTEMHMRKVA